MLCEQVILKGATARLALAIFSHGKWMNERQARVWAQPSIAPRDIKKGNHVGHLSVVDMTGGSLVHRRWPHRTEYAFSFPSSQESE